MNSSTGPYWRRRRLFAARTHRIWNSICYLASFALFVAMLTAPRWWPQ